MQASQAITRNSASNLALSFVLLPKEKRAGMSALYAFCRKIDDISDEDALPLEQRRALLAEWRRDIQTACDQGTPRLTIIQELQPSIARHHLPYPLFDELLKGVEMDLELSRYPAFEDLELYCYRVASVVGLLSIEIFGYSNPQCRQYAVYLGKALQLTNILRDVRGDAERGRIYLPLEMLSQFQVAPEEILQFKYSERFRQLAQHAALQARDFYRLARQTLPPEDRRSMAPAELMGSVYWRLLEKLERNRFNIFGARPTRLSKTQKAYLVFRSWCRLWTGGLVPSYGNG